jgi:hypothetical protein
MEFKFLRLFNLSADSPETAMLDESSNNMHRALQSVRGVVGPIIEKFDQNAKSHWERYRKEARTEDEAIASWAGDIIKASETEGTGHKFAAAPDLAKGYEGAVPVLNGRLTEKVTSYLRADIDPLLSKGKNEQVLAISYLDIAARNLPEGSQSQKEIIDLWKSELYKLAKIDPDEARSNVRVAIGPGGGGSFKTTARELLEQLGTARAVKSTPVPKV